MLWNRQRRTGAVRAAAGTARAAGRSPGGRGNLVPARDRAGCFAGRRARRVPRAWRCAAGAGGRGGGNGELPAGACRRDARRYDLAARPGEAQRVGKGFTAMTLGFTRPGRWLVLALLMGGSTGCFLHHGARTPKAPPPAVPTDVELGRAMQLFRHGEFRKAQIILQRLTFELGPSQPELAQIRYYLAECWFQLGDQVQAAADFRKVADEFSTTEYAPVALLRAGDANLRLWHGPELDPTFGETALAIYQELTGRYPDSDAAARARPHVKRLENQFAEKTYKTGIFYLRRKAFDSAIIYFKDVIANYPNSARAPDALLRLVDSYRAIRYTQELDETCEHLRRFYPNAKGIGQSCPAVADSSAKPSPPSTPAN